MYGASGSRPTTVTCQLGSCASTLSATAIPAIPAPTITSRRPPLGRAAARIGSTRTAQAFSSGCSEVGSTAREVTVLSAPAPASRCSAPQWKGAKATPGGTASEMRTRRVAEPRRERTRTFSPSVKLPASSGCSSRYGCGSASSSEGDLPVRVIVCHCWATRPVVSVSGKSGVTSSAGAVWGVGARRARPSGVAKRRAPYRRSVPGWSALGHGHWSGPCFRRVCEIPLWSHSRPSVSCTYSACTAAAVRHGNASRWPSARPTRAKISQSGSASPGGSSAFWTRLTRRSEFVIVPSFSGHCAAGSSTCASAAVSVGKYASWQITRSARFSAAAKRPASGWETTGLVATIHSTLIRRSSSASTSSVAARPGSGAIPGEFQKRRTSARSSALETLR